MCSSGLEELTCLFSTKFLKSNDLRFTTSPAIATYTLLWAGFIPFLNIYIRVLPKRHQRLELQQTTITEK
jgi:hypothetical protein